MEGESDIGNALKIWLSVLISLCYCYALGKIVPAGSKRLFFVLPVVCFFLYLPLNLFSVLIGGITGFFIAWLGNFKLLLFAFGKGPLSSDATSTSLALFVAVGCLPIKIQQKQPAKSHVNDPDKTNRHLKKHVTYAIKGVVLATVVCTRDNNLSIHPKMRLFLFCLHVYLPLETGMAILAALARAMLGLELEPQFNEPYLSTSLQDFWGKRWNLMVPSILRPTVYEPTLQAATPVMGRKWAPLPAVLGTFLVSALMHELIYYYLGRMTPKGDFTWFFLLHGMCLTVEIAFKKVLAGRWRLPWLISRLLTVGFVMITSSWLFFPPLNRIELFTRLFEEYNACSAFVKNFIFRPLIA